MTENYRSKIGPIPPEAWENDALSNDVDSVETKPGSLYDKLKQRVGEAKPKPKGLPRNELWKMSVWLGLKGVKFDPNQPPDDNEE